MLVIVGAIIFPMPVPLGLPLMVFGLAMIMKTSYGMKRSVIKLTFRHPKTRSIWRKARGFRKRK